MHYRLAQPLDQGHRLPLQTPLEPKSKKGNKKNKGSKNNDHTFYPPAPNPIIKAPFPAASSPYLLRARAGKSWTRSS